MIRQLLIWILSYLMRASNMHAKAVAAQYGVAQEPCVVQASSVDGHDIHFCVTHARPAVMCL